MVLNTQMLPEILDRVKGLEHEAELMRAVLMVKEPNTVQAASAYEGLRKQILAATAERRSHLAQLVSMSVAISRAREVSDLAPQVNEWMEQAGITQVWGAPAGTSLRDFFEDLAGRGLDGQVEIVEPAYFDSQTGALLRLGRAQQVLPVAQPNRPAEDAGLPDPGTASRGTETTDTEDRGN